MDTRRQHLLYSVQPVAPPSAIWEARECCDALVYVAILQVYRCAVAILQVCGANPVGDYSGFALPSGELA